MRTLTPEGRAVVEEAEALAAAEFADEAFEWQGEMPWENLRALADADLLCPHFPSEYGGRDLTDLEAMLVTEAVARVCPDTGWFVYTQGMVGPRAIDLFGTEAVKDEYLPPVVDGEGHVAIAISEPDAGSDVGSMTTRVEETDDGLLLNGEKTWVGGVPVSDAAVVWVKFPEGLGSVVLDFDWPGVEVAKHYRNMAGYTQTRFTMEDVVVPESHVLTRGPGGFKRQLTSLNWERLGSAVVASAWATAGLVAALDYAKGRKQFGQPIADFQGIEWKLADMFKQVETATATVYGAATRAVADGTAPDRLRTSVAKLHCSEMAERVVSEAVQTVGARAYQRGHPLEYLYRLVRGRRIAAGTDEIQKNTIAAALKEDGVPSVTDRLGTGGQ